MTTDYSIFCIKIVLFLQGHIVFNSSSMCILISTFMLPFTSLLIRGMPCAKDLFYFYSTESPAWLEVIQS